MKKLRLILTFYNNYLFVCSIITLCCVKIFSDYGVVTFSSLFWFKVFTIGIIGYFTHEYKAKEFYYYQNLGLSKRVLFVTTLGFDFFVFLMVLYLMYKNA